MSVGVLSGVPRFRGRPPLNTLRSRFHVAGMLLVVDVAIIRVTSRTLSAASAAEMLPETTPALGKFAICAWIGSMGSGSAGLA